MRRDVFQAIADPTRREIISLLAKKELTPNSVAESFDVSRQAISKHIKILTECGIIAVRQEGRERYYNIEARTLSEVADWIEPFRKMWEDQFSRLDGLLLEMQSKKSTKRKSLKRKTNPKSKP